MSKTSKLAGTMLATATIAATPLTSAAGETQHVQVASTTTASVQSAQQAQVSNGAQADTRYLQDVTNGGPWFLTNRVGVTSKDIGSKCEFRIVRKANRTVYKYPYSKRGPVKHTGIKLKTVSNGYTKIMKNPRTVEYLVTSDPHPYIAEWWNMETSVPELKPGTNIRSAHVDFGK